MQQLHHHPHSATAAPVRVLTLPVTALACFRRLMQYEGWEVDMLRMCVDTAYAFERLATAHTSGDERLRRAALILFGAFERNAEVPTLH